MVEVDGTPPELSGHICEAVLVEESWYRGERVLDVAAVHLKLRDGPWHRVFFDGGVLFWRPGRPPLEGRQPASVEDFHARLVDVGTPHGLPGRRFTHVQVEDHGETAELVLHFDSGTRLVLWHHAGEGVSRVVVHVS
jgi:hypothetical protein